MIFFEASLAFQKAQAKADGCTLVRRLRSFGVVSANLQIEEVHNLLFESSAGPHFGPHLQHGGHELLPQVAQPHAAVHGHGPQENVESGDQVLQNAQMFLLSEIGKKKEYVQSDFFLFLFFLHGATPCFCRCPLPGIEQRFGEEAKQSAVVSLCLHAAALHQRAHDSAHQDAVDGLGGGAKQVAVHLQEICGTRHVNKKRTKQ